ncbi:hypothetical protein [Tautonia sociabilis]|uniref:Uncharacterized protein n=1 Tax=Tautonia sociabilis TaxID=2080755 RepID=A0A432MQS9_9BACT|nr:hypothetical protein [Tautonia sociabilis]RUL89406.1 hypothetical protein TsocGM_01130 [Tautonia sociabilis]
MHTPPRIDSAAGPDDRLGTFDHWAAGRKDPSQVAQTFSVQSDDARKERGAVGPAVNRRYPHPRYGLRFHWAMLRIAGVTSSACPALATIREAVTEVPPDDEHARGDAQRRRLRDARRSESMRTAAEIVPGWFDDREDCWRPPLLLALDDLGVGPADRPLEQTTTGHVDA